MEILGEVRQDGFPIFLADLSSMATIPHGYRISTDILKLAFQAAKDGRKVSEIDHNPWSAACPCLGEFLDWIFCKYHGIDNDVKRILNDNSFEILKAVALADTSKKKNVFYIDITERSKNVGKDTLRDVTRFRISIQSDRILLDQLFDNPHYPARELGESDISFKQLQEQCKCEYERQSTPPAKSLELLAYNLATVDISTLFVDANLARDLIGAGRNRNEVIDRYDYTERCKGNQYVDISQFDDKPEPMHVHRVDVASGDELHADRQPKEPVQIPVDTLPPDTPPMSFSLSSDFGTQPISPAPETTADSGIHIDPLQIAKSDGGASGDDPEYIGNSFVRKPKQVPILKSSSTASVPQASRRVRFNETVRIYDVDEDVVDAPLATNGGVHGNKNARIDAFLKELIAEKKMGFFSKALNFFLNRQKKIREID